MKKMANIIVEIDTTKESMKASVDGKNIADIQEVRAYFTTPWDAREDDGPEVRVEIISGKKDEESGICRTLITSCASEQVETKDSITNDLIKIFFPA
jgi:hypothetical protein